MTDNTPRKRPPGRPAGTTKFGEPTIPKRIPVSAVAEIDEFLRRRSQHSIRVVHAAAQGDLEVLHPAEVSSAADCARPLFGSSIAAGFPSPADDYIEEWLDLNNLLITDKPATFFVRVKGESMIEEGIRPGDLLVVDKGMEPQSGDIVIAVIDNELTVKELEMVQGRIRLLPANRELQPIELQEGQQLLVWGVVTAAVHQFTRARKSRPSFKR